MRSNYEEKRANRIERYERLAAKFRGESESRYKRFQQISSFIPMGQPILVGHHSEGRHRADLKRMDTNMRKSIEADDKAAHYAGKAETAEDNYAISSDDPNAIERLEEKLLKMQEKQEYMKKINKAYTTYKKKPQSLEVSDLSDKAKQFIISFVPEYSSDSLPFRRYQLSNNSGNMGNVKKRLEHLKRLNQAENKEKEFGDIRIVENPEENRVQIFFPGKPADEVRSQLKHSGFRWAPSEGSWQAYYSEHAKWKAEEIVKSIQS